MADMFWEFSLKLYAHPNVAAACLELQDHCNVDVNVLFFLIFLSCHGRQVNIGMVRDIDASVSLWRKEVVQPLRAVRRALKVGVAPVAASDSESLRSSIKREELAAERLQQESLEKAHKVAITGVTAPRELAFWKNAAAYEAILGKNFPPRLLSLLADAAATMPVARSGVT